MPLDRTWYNTLVDDSGSGTDGTIWNKAAVDALMDDIDVALALLPLAGSWTPVIGGSGGTSGQVYSQQVGRYLKVGKLVFAYFRCVLSTEGTITGNVKITGLPFTSDNVTGLLPSSPLRWGSLATTWACVIATVNTNATEADVTGAAVAAMTNTNALTATDINNTTDLSGTIMYQANA